MAIRFLLGLFAGGALTLTYAIGGRDMPASAKMGAFGTLAGIGQIGGAIAPFVTGGLSKWASLSAIFIVDAILYALILLWTWFMFTRRTRVAGADPAKREAAPAIGDD